MGTLYEGHDHESNPNIIRDLKITLQESTIVFPSQPTEPRSMFLSNIDQVLNFNVQTVHFFASNPDFPPPIVTEKLKSALSQALVEYDFLGGRLKLNPEPGRLEIDCNAAGAGFVVASSEYSMNEIGYLVYPNPGFRQLIVQTLDNLSPDEDQPLCIVQVTSFKCGGFAIGTATNHATFDGISFKTFLINLASLAASKPLAITPFNDRRLLAARSPPRVTFPHPELLKIPVNVQDEGLETLKSPPVFDCPQEDDLHFRIFHLTSDDIARLKDKAKPDTCIGHVKITGFNVVTAHLWRCKALSNEENNPDSMSTVLYAVDIRPRLNPPLPRSYTGNAVLSAYATARCEELEEGQPFLKLVQLVSEGATRITDEYARSAIDWGEVNKGFPHGEFLISSWWRLGFDEVEYPWGKPKYSCPVVYQRKDIILLFPVLKSKIIEEDGGVKSNIPNHEGVNVLVALPAKEMVKFQTLFYKLLES